MRKAIESNEQNNCLQKSATLKTIIKLILIKNS